MNDFLKRYVPVADMIAQTIGPQCEVVLHDMFTPLHSVVYIVNNRVTGRKIGDSFSLIISEVLLSKRFENDMLCNYSFTTADGRLIKSSTVLLRDEQGQVAGAMCVNIDTTAVTEHIRWLETMLPAPQGQNAAARENNDAPHVLEVVDEVIDKIFSNRDGKKMTREEKLDLMRVMESRGIFLTKGAIEKVAEKMGVSKVTVYSYLDELKNRGETGPARDPLL